MVQLAKPVAHRVPSPPGKSSTAKASKALSAAVSSGDVAAVARALMKQQQQQQPQQHVHSSEGDGLASLSAAARRATSVAAASKVLSGIARFKAGRRASKVPGASSGSSLTAATNDKAPAKQAAALGRRGSGSTHKTDTADKADVAALASGSASVASKGSRATKGSRASKAGRRVGAGLPELDE